MTRPNPFPTPAQCRAARGLLNWSQTDLAKAAGLKTYRTVQRFESGGRIPRDLHAIRSALEDAGVEFTNGDQPGVRPAKSA